jgi:plastocyanin
VKRSLLVVLAMVALSLGACGGGDDDDGSTAADDGGGGGAAATNVITIENSSFSGVTSVPDGSSVTVENKDDTQHTFTPDTAGDFQAASLNGGKSATIKMPGPGTYKYHCSIHTTMTGEITVEA